MEKLIKIRMPTLLVLLLLIPIAACGVPKAARNSANLLSAYTNNIKNEGIKFSKFRNDLAKFRLRDTVELEKQVVTNEQSVSQFLSGWKVKPGAKDSRLTLYEGLLESSEQTVQSQLSLSELDKEQLAISSSLNEAVNFRSDKLTETAKALSLLGSEQNFQEYLKFLINFFKEVQTSLDELETDTSNQATEASEKPLAADPQ